MLEKVYKIVLKEKNTFKTLFRGIEGSRILFRNRWLKAEKKMGRDGSGQKRYLTGIHCFRNKKIAEDYLSNFRTEKNRIVIECFAKGLRRKPSNENVFLANEILIKL